MLTRHAATLIVHSSINRVASQALKSNTQRLVDVGVTNVSPLIDIIVSDLKRRAVSYVLDPRFLSNITPDTFIGDLIDHVMQISAPKVCAGPQHHPQTSPYPANCPIDGFPFV